MFNWIRNAWNATKRVVVSAVRTVVSAVKRVASAVVSGVKDLLGLPVIMLEMFIEDSQIPQEELIRGHGDGLVIRVEVLVEVYRMEPIE